MNSIPSQPYNPLNLNLKDEKDREVQELAQHLILKLPSLINYKCNDFESNK